MEDEAAAYEKEEEREERREEKDLLVAIEVENVQSELGIKLFPKVGGALRCLLLLPSLTLLSCLK